MKNVLLDKGIILPSGEISKDKVNLVAGAITQPFAEMVWVTTGGDMETINRLTDILVSMNTPADLALFRGSRAYGRRPRRFGILHFFLYSRLWRSHARPHCRRNRITYRKGGVSSIPQREKRNAVFLCPHVTQ